jgi:hypothetical protein
MSSVTFLVYDCSIVPHVRGIIYCNRSDGVICSKLSMGKVGD